jgi:tetratricopeptide (TPR) repeat protein/membrane protease YdiL (CAAX protease family)
MDMPPSPPPLPSASPPPLPPPPVAPPRGFWVALLLGIAGTVVLLASQALAAVIFAGIAGFKSFTAHHRVIPTAITQQLSTDPLLLAVCVFGSLPAVWGALWIMVRIQRGGRFTDFLALRGFRWTQLLLWGAILAAVVVGSDRLLRLIASPDDAGFTLNLLLPGPSLPWIVAAIILGAPLVEEPLFRGFMYRGLARSRWTTLVAILLPNCLWLALHVQYHWPTLIELFLVGIVLGLSRHFSGSTLLPILLHVGMNAFAALAALALLHPVGPIGLDLSRPTVLACMMQATAAKKSGDTDAALAAYTAALDLDPKNQEALEKRGLLHQSADDIEAAIADFTALLPLVPDPARILYLRARALVLNDDDSPALADLDRAITLDSRAYRAYSLRADIYGRKRDYDRAIADSQAALRLNPDFLPALRNLGSAYYESGDYDRAIAQFDHALRLFPQSSRDHVSRGIAYGNKGDTDRAITDFSAAIRLAPRYAMAYFDRGYAWYQKHDYRKAFLDFSRALELNPDDTTAANSLAWLFATCPDPIFRDGALAVRYAEQACRATDWKKPAYLDTLAAAYAEHGEWNKAIWWQERYLASALNPDDMARLRLTRYRHHQAYTE